MIRRVLRRAVPALVIIGWISLAVFDVLEDLDEAPGRSALSTTPESESSGSKRGGWGPLANNAVESASRPTHLEAATLPSTPKIFSLFIITDPRKSFRLHKLYHIFLI